MRIYPMPGLALRDPRTMRLVDPEEGVEVDDGDLTFAWLLAHDDASETPPALAKTPPPPAAKADKPPPAPPAPPAAAEPKGADA